MTSLNRLTLLRKDSTAAVSSYNLTRLTPLRAAENAHNTPF
jgi:hypothetical protein